MLTDREPRCLYCALCGAAANGLPTSPLPDDVASADGVALPPLPELRAANPPLAAAQGAGEGGAGPLPECRLVSAAALDWFDPVDTLVGDILSSIVSIVSFVGISSLRRISHIAKSLQRS